MSRLTTALIASTFCCLAFADQAVAPKTVTLVVTFDGASAQPEVVDALKSELAEIWKGEAVKLNWKPIESVRSGESFADLVVVHFKGDCHLHALSPFLIDERGPQGGALAYSPMVDGVVQPFSSVLCDRVQRSVQLALKPGQRKSAQKLYGRALGRVLSHELYHILNHTKEHERQGLARKSLTGQQLIAPGFRFDVSGGHSGQ